MLAKKEPVSSKLRTRPREVLAFGDTRWGRTFSGALCGENEHGRLGPLSPVLRARVIA
ncbi:MAG: hypothetical protein LBK00_11015 [Treponema sp.]|jgi:hypothetical protein|nr:hypothetical protein [Treponema sp.]